MNHARGAGGAGGWTQRAVARAWGVAAAVAALAAAVPASAGPPFATDDPIPVETGHWEVYGFSDRVEADDDRNGALVGLEVNYGAAPDLQLHLIAPIAFDDPTGGDFHAGPGDLELGAKYRLVDSDKVHGWPSIAVFPLVEVPVGKASAGLGAGYAQVFLPVWVQKDFGRWITYGGGGYWINPGPGNQNYWFVGWEVQRQITRKLAIGGEVYYQTADDPDSRDSSGFNLGLIYDITEHYHLLLSAGSALHNPANNRFSYYVGLQRTF